MANGLRRLHAFLTTFSVGAATAWAYGFPDCVNGPLKSNAVCDITKDPITRATALIGLWTDEELTSNTVNASPGVPRLGLPAYNWWSEGLHGVAQSPGVTFAPSGNFSHATSFPQPILMGAAFDDTLIQAIATIVSTEGRAFNNAGRAGLDYWTPNINPFKDPRWGRGQETPGEDPFHLSQYVYNLILGLQGGLDPKPYFKVVADCKHFAAYDLENWEGIVRNGFDAIVSQQDLSEFYLPPFQTCVRDAKVASVMCSYNAVNGIPSCANSFLLQDVLRDHWGFTDDRWVTSDCDAVENILTPHKYTTDPAQAAADALLAGTDIDCGTFSSTYLPEALQRGLVNSTDLRRAAIRQYASLVRLGYFDDPAAQPYRQLGWSDVNTPQAQQLAHTAAVEGIVLLKNDGVLPFSKHVRKLALIGPWANATSLLQGSYIGVAPYLVSPLQGAQEAGFEVEYVLGTNVTTQNDMSGFAAAVAAVRRADAVVFAGGLDETVECEGTDRLNVTWPGNQLDLVAELERVGKPLIVAQFGGGQLDDTALKHSKAVNAIIWGGYPGQSGGTALFDILTGKAAPAGRLPITQYPAAYTKQVPMTDMSLRPSATNPGRTYKWYSGTPVFEFGFGLHYTTFVFSWAAPSAAAAVDSTASFGSLAKSYSISQLVAHGQESTAFLDLAPLDTFAVRVTNTGRVASDYVALLFVSGAFGPAPHPKKQLVAYTRVHGLAPRGSTVAQLPVTLGAIARADKNGEKWVHPGTYTLALDTDAVLTHTFTLTGSAVKIASWPKDSSS
ncbi:glycoside hydrolase family 3 protein [Trametes versicolor FP-101664 SS1]|uniref:glycoside hydrolase family 3 protein n=1 Tax=Trametes versicolor (strain FP-101664) TaxID=717944 RepID=UPI00046224BC|nr:glycoside hydrolase family 3 protein [Trametes versicolor FP-101664 SS1]EIW53941.1 glycoside hydrolase family 3 protein [Trametes versicolor FP-101664 SS1]